MSFFYDFLKELHIDDLSDKVAISMILNEGIMILGNIKLLNFSEESIVLSLKDKEIVVEGENLKIKTIAKGELVVVGNILKVSEEK